MHFDMKGPRRNPPGAVFLWLVCCDPRRNGILANKALGGTADGDLVGSEDLGPVKGIFRSASRGEVLYSP